MGGGSLPGETLPTWVLALDASGFGDGAEGVMRRLRQNTPPVVARIEDERVLFDPRTVDPEDDPALLRALAEAL